MSCVWLVNCLAMAVEQAVALSCVWLVYCLAMAEHRTVALSCGWVGIYEGAVAQNVMTCN